MRSFTIWCPPCACPIAHLTLSASRPPPEHLPLLSRRVSFPSEYPPFLQGATRMPLPGFSQHVPAQVYSTTNYPGVIFPSDRRLLGRQEVLSVTCCLIGGVTMTREPRGVQKQGTWVSGAASAVTNSDQQTGSTEAAQLKLLAQDPRAENFWPMDFSMK